MPLPNIIQVTNITGTDHIISDLGVPVAAGQTIVLTNYATLIEIKNSLSLYDAIVSDIFLITISDVNLSKSESLRIFIETLDSGSRNTVDVASTKLIASLSGIGATIDDVVLTSGMRVLLTAQTNSVSNGIWIVKSGSWVRPYDSFTGQSISGISVVVKMGTNNGDAIWVCSSDPGTDIVETSSLFFSKQEADASNQLAVGFFKYIVNRGVTAIAPTRGIGNITLV